MIMSDTIRGWFINLGSNPTLQEILDSKASTSSPSVVVYQNGAWSEVSGSDTMLAEIDQFLQDNGVASQRPPVNMLPSMTSDTFLNAGEYLKCVLYAAKESSLTYDPTHGEIQRPCTVRVTCPTSYAGVAGTSFELHTSPFSLPAANVTVSYDADAYSVNYKFAMNGAGFALDANPNWYKSCQIQGDTDIVYWFKQLNGLSDASYVYCEAAGGGPTEIEVPATSVRMALAGNTHLNVHVLFRPKGLIPTAPRGGSPSGQIRSDKYFVRVDLTLDNNTPVCTYEGVNYMAVSLYMFPCSHTPRGETYDLIEGGRLGYLPVLPNDELPIVIKHLNGVGNMVTEKVLFTPPNGVKMYPCIAQAEYANGSIVADYTGHIGERLGTSAPVIRGSSSGGYVSIPGSFSFKRIEAWSSTSVTQPTTGISSQSGSLTIVGASNGAIATRLTLPEGGTATELGNIVTTATNATAAFATGVSFYDGYDGTPIYDDITRQKVIDFVNQTSCLEADSFMASEADYMGFVIAQYFVDAVISAASQNLPSLEYDLYGLSVSSTLMDDGENDCTVLSYINGTHPKQDQITMALVETRTYLTFRILLHNVLRQAAGTTEYLNSVYDIVEHLSNETYKMFTAVTTMAGKSSYVNQAMMYSYADQDNAISKVRSFLTMASSFGASSFEAAYDLLVQNMPETLAYQPPKVVFSQDEDIDIGEFITDILTQSTYAGSIANSTTCIYKRSSEVPRWSTWAQRMTSAVFSLGGVDSEVADCGGGADYIFPAIVHGYVNNIATDIWDRYLPTEGSVIMCPFTHSYCELRKGSVAGVLEVSWYARFRGGTERDALDAIHESYNEYKYVISNLASIVQSDHPWTITFPDIPSAMNPGYQGNAEMAMNMTDIVTNLHVEQTLGTMGEYFARIQAATFAATADAVQSFLTGAAFDYAQSVYDNMGTPGESTVQQANTNASIALSKLWDFDMTQWSVIATIQGSPVDYTGADALNACNTLLAGMITAGAFAPFSYGDDPIQTGKIAVMSSCRIAPRYCVREVTEDWTPLVLTAAVIGAAIYGGWWLRLPKVRAVNFLPSIILGGVASATSTVAHKLSAALAAKTAKESTLLGLADSMDAQAQDTNAALTSVLEQQKEDSAKLNTVLAAVGAGGLLATAIGVAVANTASDGPLASSVNNHVSDEAQKLKKAFKGNRPTLPA